MALQDSCLSISGCRKVQYFNDIVVLAKAAPSATFVDFPLTIMHSIHLDSVKGAINGNSSFDFQQP
jgi:hypothetical protein